MLIVYYILVVFALKRQASCDVRLCLEISENVERVKMITMEHDLPALRSDQQIETSRIQV